MDALLQRGARFLFAFPLFPLLPRNNREQEGESASDITDDCMAEEAVVLRPD